MRKNNTLCLENEDGKKYFPVESIRDIYVFGEVDLNKKVFEFLEKHEILMHFFGYYDNYAGTFYPREHYNSGYIILKQAEHYLSPEFRFEIAKQFVKGALANIVQVLRYYRNRGKDLEQQIEAVKEILKSDFKKCSSIEELMALEGNARKYYYGSFNVILEGTSFFMGERTKKPPSDPLNALISFGNSLVYTKVLTEIYKTHLDPRIGYLHTTNFRRFTLNLDLAEIFKPLIADRVLLSLIAKKMLSPKDFDLKGGICLLKENGKKNYVQEFENKLKSTFYHRRLKRNVSYQTLIRLELYKLEKHLIGEKKYEPFVSRW